MVSKTAVRKYAPPPDELVDDGIYYPDSDGEPMADTGPQAETMGYIYDALKEWFREQENVYVAMNMFLYYVRGDVSKVVAPDIYVMFGADGKRLRRIWMAWRENDTLPGFVLEIGSPSTHEYDAGEKRDIYAGMGAGEYWRFDSLGDQFSPVLIGERLVDGEYRRIDVYADESGILRGYSPALGLDLCVLDSGELRFYDPAGGEWLLSHGESEAARRRAEAGQRRAEAEARRLRELLEQAGSRSE